MSVLRRIYNATLRPYLPERLAVYNGVAVRNIKLLDRTDVFPEFESALVDGIRDHIEEGDRCVVVGTGRGVTTTVAARQTGPTGTVMGYEAAQESVKLTRETIRINRVEDIASVEHAIVGVPGTLRGTPGIADTLKASEIPAGDVLILDCNGAESDVLPALTHTPRVLFVRVNGLEGVDESDIESEMEQTGYELIDRTVEVEETGVVLLVGRRRNGGEDT